MVFFFELNPSLIEEMDDILLVKLTQGTLEEATVTGNMFDELSLRGSIGDVTPSSTR